MKRTHRSDTFDGLMEIVENSPASLAEYKVELLRMALASSLKKARERSRKTQRQIAESLGVQQPWVSKLESCNNDHTFESLAKYAFAVGADITLSMIFDGAAPMELASSIDRSNSRAKKYKAGHLPKFIDYFDESTADGARREDWDWSTAGLGSQPQSSLVGYVA